VRISNSIAIELPTWALKYLKRIQSTDNLANVMMVEDGNRPTSCGHALVWESWMADIHSNPQCAGGTGPLVVFDNGHRYGGYWMLEQLDMDCLTRIEDLQSNT